MKTSVSLLASLALATISANAAGSEPKQANANLQPTLVPAGLIDQESLRLARQFVGMYYPTSHQDAMDQLREASYAQLDEIQSVAFRTSMSGELEKTLIAVRPIVQEQTTLVMESYAQAYASEYKADELRQLIAFGTTPVGRHFLDKASFVENDPGVRSARETMYQAVLPAFENMSKEMCRQSTKSRIAAGDRKAKCTLG